MNASALSAVASACRRLIGELGVCVVTAAAALVAGCGSASTPTVSAVQVRTQLRQICDRPAARLTQADAANGEASIRQFESGIAAAIVFTDDVGPKMVAIHGPARINNALRELAAANRRIVAAYKNFVRLLAARARLGPMRFSTVDELLKPEKAQEGSASLIAAEANLPGECVAHLAL